MKDARTFSINELATLSELPRRTVRYYVQAGLLSRPNGVGKGAYYTQAHLDQLLQIRKWQLAGLSLERIGELLRRDDEDALLPPTPRRAGTVEVWSHLVVADGIEVTVEPSRSGLSPEQLRAFFREVGAVYERIKGGKP